MSNVGLINGKRVSKHTKKKCLIRHHNAKHVVTKIKNIIQPTQCSTSTPIDQVKTVLNTVS